MWILECNNNQFQDSIFSTRRLELDPNPFSTTFSTSQTHSFYNHNINIPTWNQTLTLGDYGGYKREMTSKMPPLVSSRWNPTPEQVQALEEMYRNGVKTPSAMQIQHITAKLGRFGRIEGKNVFYWFQNHKARERQKKRQLAAEEKSTETRAPDRRPLGNRRSCLETKHSKMMLLEPSSCSTASECSASMQGEKCKKIRQDTWTHVNCKELQEQNLTEVGPHTFSKLDLLCIKAPQENEKSHQKSFPSQDVEFEFIETRVIEENQKTLHLFPIGRDDDLSITKAETETEENGIDPTCVSSLRTELVPIRFFKFFPMK